MATTRVHIEPNIFTWAVERAGKSVEEYKDKNDKFGSWLNGSALPTFKNVEDFAKKFYVPLGYMFLESPPHEECPIPFFRSTTNQHNNINVYDTILTLQDRQRWLSDYLRGEGFEKNSLVGSLTLGQTTLHKEEAVKHLRQVLNLPKDWAFKHKTIDDALRYLTSLIEDKEVFVSYNGVVGFNSNREIPVKDCRGFTLIDDYAPFIFVNNKDAKSAQLFTLIHEFVHVLIGYSAGIGDNSEEELEDNESFCNSVAAMFFVPSDLLKSEWNNHSEDFRQLSREFKVSKVVIARRAKEIGLINTSRFFELYNKWKNEPLISPKKSAGGAFFPLAIKKLGRTFLIHVNNAISNDKLLHMEAYRLTGLRGNTFHKVINSKEFARV